MAASSNTAETVAEESEKKDGDDESPNRPPKSGSSIEELIFSQSET
jgi:hypothetical protein